MLYESECSAVKNQQKNKISVAEMWIMCRKYDIGNTRQNYVINDIREKIGVASIIEKLVETWLRLFGLVETIPVDFVVKRVDQMESSQIT